MKLVVKYKINSLFKTYVKQGSMKMLHAAILFSGKKEQACVEHSIRQTVFVCFLLHSDRKPMFMSAIKESACCTSARPELWEKKVPTIKISFKIAFPKLVENNLIISSANISYSVWSC